MTDIKLKQAFIPSDLKKVASAFKTTLRNTTYNADNHRGGLPAPAPAPFVHRQMLFERPPETPRADGDGCALVFNPRATSCPSAEAILSRLRPSCTGCGGSSIQAYVCCDLVTCPWLPFCKRCLIQKLSL